MNGKEAMVEQLTLTVLAEDYAGQNSPYWGQHGAAYLVQLVTGGERHTLLFDTGSFAEPILRNMQKLRLDPGEIEMIVLSHSHFDHTGGLLGILRAMGKEYVPLVAHPAIHRTSFAVNPFWFDTAYPMPAVRREAEQLGGFWALSADPLPLGNGIIFSGAVPRETEFEPKEHRGLWELKDDRTVADTIPDDTSLYFVTPAGLVIVTGCAHAGIVNIIRHAMAVTGCGEVAAVIGGFHLIGASDERISQTTAALQENPKLQIYTGHCTGLKAEGRLLDAFGQNFTKLACGLSIDPIKKAP